MRDDKIDGSFILVARKAVVTETLILIHQTQAKLFLELVLVNFIFTYVSSDAYWVTYKTNHRLRIWQA